MQVLNEYPKILVVSINAWQDKSGINTLINFFKFWTPERIAQIYTRSALPNTRVCHRFFQISESAVICSIGKRRHAVTGREVTNSDTPDAKGREELEQEKRRYGKVWKNHSSLMTLLREVVWFLGRWKTPELDRFIDEFDTDILFLPIYPTIYMGRLQRYIQKRTKKPAICYLADDNYTYIPCGWNPFALLHRFFLRRIVKAVVDNCQDMLVIAPKQKQEYDRIFHKNSKILTKGIDFSTLSYRPIVPGMPIRMVYTGKLIIGRWNSLSLIAEALGQINKDQERIILDIYTTDELTDQQRKCLNRNGSNVRGALSGEQVTHEQAKADIVVFVESLLPRYRYAARLSFSTKLTDYLKSGKCIFAIGDKDIAPIDYLEREECAVIANSYESVYRQLGDLVEHPEKIDIYGMKAFQCGLKNHDESKVRETLLTTIRELL